MRLAKRGEKFSGNVIFNDKFALVSIREPEVNKVTIIGPGMPFVTLNEKNEICGFSITSMQVLEKEDWPTLKGWVVAFYETERGKEESIRSKAKQLAKILDSDEFSNIDTIELIGIEKIGLLFLIASQYVERRIHIATIGLKTCMPYLEYTYYNKDSIVIPYIRKKYEEKLLQYIKFEDIAARHKWIDFEDKETNEIYPLKKLWCLEIVNINLKLRGGKKIQELMDKNFLIETKYSDIMSEVYYYFQR